MSHFEDNKYRIRDLLPGYKLKSKARTRLETIKSIAAWLKLNQGVSNQMKFCQRNISPTHRGTLLKCAQLWNDLDRMEEEVKNRLPKKSF
jgi:hypothetical protein